MPRTSISNKVLEKMECVYTFILSYIKERDYAPTIREICVRCNIKSTASAYYYVKKLINQGRLDKSALPSRNFAPKHYDKKFVKIPLINTISNKFDDIFNESNIVSLYPLPPEFGDEKDCFAIKIRDNLMKNSGFINYDTVICKKNSYFSNGDLAIVIINNQLVLRKIYNQNNVIIAQTDCFENTINTQLNSEKYVVGKVIGLIRKY